MIFDPENIPLVPNDWFKTQVNYEGRGRAEFHDPSVTIEGTRDINRRKRWRLLVASPRNYDFTVPLFWQASEEVEVNMGLNTLSKLGAPLIRS